MAKKYVDKAKLDAKIEGLIENGRMLITEKSELEKFPIGSLISFMSKSNTFKEGGFLLKKENDSFIYVKPDFYTKYRVKYINVKQIWIGNVYQTKNDLVSIIKSEQKKETNFPVILDDIVVYYGRNTFDARRFKNTLKFKTMITWYEYFKQSIDDK